MQKFHVKRVIKPFCTSLARRDYTSLRDHSLSALVWPGGIIPPCMVTDRWLSQISSHLTLKKGDHGESADTAYALLAM